MFEPEYLYYLISLKCNQKCSKCSHWKMKAEKDLNSDLLIQNMKHLKKLKELCIVGGEPLLFSDEIIDIIKNTPENIRIVIITNGVLLKRGFIDEVKDFNIHIVVSIDTFDKEFWSYVRGVDSYDTVIDNLNYALKNIKPEKISIQSVLAEETKDHVKAVSEFAQKNGIYHAVQLYITDGFEGNWTPITESEYNIEKSEDCRCYAANRNLSILPNGDIYTCFQQNLIPECEKPLGNLNNESLDNILSTDYCRFVLNKMEKCNLPCKVLKCNQMVENNESNK